MKPRHDLVTASGETTAKGGAPGRARRVSVVFAPEPCVAVALLGPAPLAIGRDPDAAEALRLPDDQASRTHATIEYDAATDGHFLVDRESRNGTFVDGARVERARLVDGSVVRIGRSLLVFSDEVLPSTRLVGETPALSGMSLRMQALRGEIETAAARAFPVLVLGETGTGKERVAEEIHRASGLRGPFVPLNCATIPAALAETELFGHTVGAFTGATKKADGLFAAADRGTLFLDEIGELPPSVQPKLLRVLAVGEVRAVGSARRERVDVRVVAATHRDLAADVGAGSFRADLYARLSVFTIRVPPLRDRRDDILRLAERFLGAGGDALPLSARAAEALLLFAWPFNVRQLENVLAAAAARARGAGTLRREHLPPELLQQGTEARAPSSVPPSDAPDERDERDERDEGERRLRGLVSEHRGNVAAVARAMGKAPTQIFRWLQRYGIDPDRYRRR